MHSLREESVGFSTCSSKSAGAKASNEFKSTYHDLQSFSNKIISCLMNHIVNVPQLMTYNYPWERAGKCCGCDFPFAVFKPLSEPVISWCKNWQCWTD